MTNFEIYFELGLDHILSKTAFDHILFVMALCTIFSLQYWKKVVVLVTAFTIGHSLTLALVVTNVIQVNSELVETLIPITIIVTCFANIWNRHIPLGEHASKTNYYLALFFGLIHGMAFSNYLRSILGQQNSIIEELFAFNIGLEVGQLVVVLIFLLLSFAIQLLGQVERRDWILAISSTIAGISFFMIIN